MMLRLEPCACGLHVRFLGAVGTAPVEAASKEMAYAMLDAAVRNGIAHAGELPFFLAMIGRSLLAEEEAAIDEALRKRVVLWNLAAASTNDPDAFGQTDFHAYYALVDDFGKSDPAPT